MISIISDLHLQHTAPEAVRHRDTGGVWETGVRRNVPAEAVGLLFNEIAEVALQRHSREVHLVLAGDIFECHRAPLWFAGLDTSLRPTDAPGPDGSPLCRKTLAILDAVAEENSAFLAELRSRVAAGVGGLAVQLHYLPGNHDRLVDLWPSTRIRVRTLLGLPPSDARFPRVLDWPADAGGPGVRVRHGQEYDPPNIGETDGHLDYDAPCAGDFATVDVAARLALSFRVHNARLLHDAGPAGDGVRALYAALTGFDDVRPASRLAAFLVSRAGADRAEVMRLLRPVLAEVYATSTHDAAFGRMRAHGTHLAFTEPLATLLKAAIADLPSPLLAAAIEGVARLDARPIGPALAEGAAGEEGVGTRFHTIVSGHSHQPAIVPLADGAWYVNSGTWRPRLDAGVGSAWGLVRACTMVFCFDAAEASASPEWRRVETWTGHFAADRIGAYCERVPPANADPRRLVLHEAEVLAGEMAGRLEVGADGVSTPLHLPPSPAGARIPLGGATLPLDADLDGEVWVIGPGGDDAPWASVRLPRAPDGAFARGPVGMGLASLDGRGVRRGVLRVWGEVV